MVGQKWIGGVEGDKEGMVAVCWRHDVRTGIFT